MVYMNITIYNYFCLDGVTVQIAKIQFGTVYNQPFSICHTVPTSKIVFGTAQNMTKADTRALLHTVPIKENAFGTVSNSIFKVICGRKLPSQTRKLQLGRYATHTYHQTNTVPNGKTSFGTVKIITKQNQIKNASVT